MEEQPRREWARDLCVEAFKEAGVKLREDDSIILVAAVFKRALDSWLLMNATELDKHKKVMVSIAEAWQANVHNALEEHSDALRARLNADLQRAEYMASQAVNKALSISGKDSEWRYRAQGFFGGLAIFVVVVIMARLF